jgi:FLVCR family MFS transporter
MCVLVGFFINGTIPLYYELCCDACYPIAEGLTAGALITLNNLFCAIFLVIPTFVPGTAWMNWGMVCAAVVSVPIFVLFPPQQKRLGVDSGKVPLPEDE